MLKYQERLKYCELVLRFGAEDHGVVASRFPAEDVSSLTPTQ